MTQYRIYGAVILLLSTGCVTGQQHFASQAETPGTECAVLNKPTITKVDYEEAMTPELIQPPAVTEGLALEPNVSVAERLPTASRLTLTALEQMAFGSNPAITQSEARVRALRGKWVQVGLAPNPTVGYTAGEVGNDGKAGQQGGFAGQTFITAHKLQRNRAVVAAEITRAEQELAQVQRRVQTDVRQGFYEALLAQRRVELADQLVRVTSEAVTASQSLLEAEEIPLAGLLQTEVQQQNAIVLSRTAANALSQAWRRLSAVVSSADLPIQPLEGDVTQLPETLDWQQQLARVSNESPEIAAAMADVERARRALDRATVEAIPDISTQVTVQYDASSTDTITGVQIGIPLPLWNRNQGGIRQAQAEVTEAVRNVDRVELDLNQRLADAFREYSDAQVTATSYAEELLPRSQRTFDLVQRGFQQGEVGYLDLLAAQQTYSQSNLIYLDALGNLWRSYVRIEGLLLEGSLDAR